MKLYERNEFAIYRLLSIESKKICFESLLSIKKLDDLTHLSVLFCLNAPDALSDRRHEYSQLVAEILRKHAYGRIAVWLKIPSSLAAALAVPTTTVARTIHTITKAYVQHHIRQ